MLLCITLAQKFSEESVQVIKAFNIFLTQTLTILQTQYLVQVNVFPILKKCLRFKFNFVELLLSNGPAKKQAEKQ